MVALARLTYNPPPLNQRIKIRDMLEQPNDPNTDWGIETWANKRDANPYTQLEENQVEVTRRTIFTIRQRDDFQPEGAVQVEHKGVLYLMQGAPLVRGGANAGMVQEYVEIHCERRAIHSNA